MIKAAQEESKAKVQFETKTYAYVRYCQHSTSVHCTTANEMGFFLNPISLMTAATYIAF